MQESISFYSLSKREVVYYFLGILFLFSSKVAAQNDTIFFDKNWKTSTKEAALYYRIKPLKIKAKDAVGYNIKNTDSLFVINDYYLQNNKIQFQGYSTDYNGEYLVGKAKWYDENKNLTDSKDFNYKNYNKSKSEFPELPILFLDYKITTQSQFIGGLEFCLNCESENKLFLGLGFGVTTYNNTSYGLPDLHLSYNTKNLLFVKGGLSDKHAYALAGFTLFNVLDLGAGYSQPFDNGKIPVIKGFTFGATFRLSAHPKKVYTQIRIM